MLSKVKPKLCNKDLIFAFRRIKPTSKVSEDVDIKKLNFWKAMKKLRKIMDFAIIIKLSHIDYITFNVAFYQDNS